MSMPQSAVAHGAQQRADPFEPPELRPWLCADEADLAPQPAADWRIARECELLAASGLFDASFYAKHNTDIVRAGAEPLEHFCRHGWRELRDPSSTFNVWWYWATHLDPAHERINPLVHYALVGREAGLDTRPGPYQPTGTGAALPTDRPARRACLFAAYDIDGMVDDCVLDYLRELARHADVWYFADADMQPGQLEKLAGVTQGAWAGRHGAYDFGSWSRLARDHVGWDTLARYDEVILANDSCYLLRDLDEVFARMDGRRCDWWGMQATKGLHATRRKRENQFPEPIPMETVRRQWLPRYEQEYPFDFLIGSYFLAFRQPVLRDAGFRRRLDAVVPQARKLNTIRKYEIGLERYLMAAGHPFDTFIDRLYPFHPVYSAYAFDLIGEGFPFLKRYLLTENHYRTPDLGNWRERVRTYLPAARLEYIERNLRRTANYEKVHRNLRITQGRAGHAALPRILIGDSFRHADAISPTFDHWWAFPVCAFTHQFTGNERAVFEAVKDDPSIKKIVLARSRYIDVDGENVVMVPLRSPEGQHYLMRSRQIFIKHTPTRNICFPVSADTHNIINLWHGIPLKRIGYASLDMRERLEALAEEHRQCRAVISSSRVDALAMTAAFYPLSYESIWITGLPRHDFITRDLERLPAHLREQAERLQALTQGRRLVLFAPTFRNEHGGEQTWYDFRPEELAWLHAWLARHDAVLGVREHMADRAHPYTAALADIGALDLGSVRFADIEMLYRQADLLITDYSSSFIDFMLTGRPMVSFAYDYEQYVNQERGMFYALEQVFPGPVCRNFAALRAALEQAFEPSDAAQRAAYNWKRQMFYDHHDDANAWRVVQCVKQLYRGTPIDRPAAPAQHAPAMEEGAPSVPSVTNYRSL
jgi:CDP-glycerol glycerophosphotransferase (TagB/SpsB family)